MTEKHESDDRPGYVYILTNDAMPGLVKIGRTGRDVESRAAELWQTGVPSKFEIYCTFKTPDCVQLEAYAHAALSQYRVSRSREFFKVDPETACVEVHFWLERQAEDFGARYLDRTFAYEMSGASIGVPMVVRPAREVVRGDAIDALAKSMGHDAWTISHALSILTVEEIRPAVERALLVQNETKQNLEDDWEAILNG